MGGDGIFAKYQPRYAEQNVITFPVSADKKPAIKHWQRLGLKGSAKLAAKFADVDTFGFPLGPRSGLTILDVDTKDKGVLHEAQSRYGEVTLPCGNRRRLSRLLSLWWRAPTHKAMGTRPSNRRAW